MEDLERVAARLERVEQQIESLQQQVSRLATHGVPEDRSRAWLHTAPGSTPGPEEQHGRGRRSFAGPIALTGRTLVVIGGAYLLRAVSDRELVPLVAGALAALFYASWWLVLAGRRGNAATKGQSALFHGVAAAIIAYPVVWESTVRFEVFSPAVAAIALASLLALGLGVAVRRQLDALAWLFVLANAVTSLALISATRAYVPFSMVLLLAAGLVEIVCRGDRAPALRWAGAFGIDFATIALVATVLGTDAASESTERLPGTTSLAVLLLLPLVYLVSIGARTLIRGGTITVFGAVQLAASLSLGLGGATQVSAANGLSVTPVGLATVLLGAACYATAFSVIDRRLGRGANFYAYSSFGCLLLVGGAALLTRGAALPIALSCLALTAAVIGRSFDRITLEAHAAAYLSVAGVVSGLLDAGTHGLTADPALAWSGSRPLVAGVGLTAAACWCALALRVHRIESEWYELIPRSVLASWFLWWMAGTVAGGLARSAMSIWPTTDAAVLAATTRTLVISLAATALAGAARRWSLRELGWLVYPVLVAGGLKLVAVDLRLGEPITLFVALAAYGGALIATPRLLRRSGEIAARA